METKEIDITDGMRQLYIPRLNMVSKCTEEGLRTWLASNDSFVPSSSGRGDSFELVFYDISTFLSCLASDISRLSCASIESLNNINEALEPKKFLAWELVKYYYSAFYSAHSTLKICGFGLVQLDQRILNNIKNRANTLGSALPSLGKGIYCFKIDGASSKVTFFRVGRYDDNHKGLWHRYIDFLDVLSGLSVETNNLDANCIRKNESAAKPKMCIYTQMPLADAEAVVSRLDELKAVINKRGDSNWLSSIRNMINYNHAYGVWFPYKQFEESHFQIPTLKDLYLLSPLSEQLSLDSLPSLSEYVKCCQLVNSINYSLLNDLAKRHPDSKSFLLKGPFAYIKLYKKPG